MLVLTRKVGEQIVINGAIVVEVVEIQGRRVRIGLKAPQEVTIMRQELLPLLDNPNALPSPARTHPTGAS